jgi:hypothetical protein
MVRADDRERAGRAEGWGRSERMKTRQAGKGSGRSRSGSRRRGKKGGEKGTGRIRGTGCERRRAEEGREGQAQEPPVRIKFVPSPPPRTSVISGTSISGILTEGEEAD